MASATVCTLADLLQQFGPIPAMRVRTNPAPGSATEQDVIDLERREARLYELYDGVWLEKVMGFYESCCTPARASSAISPSVATARSAVWTKGATGSIPSSC